MKSIRVIVCGGRDYVNKKRVYQVLDLYHRWYGISCLIQGGAKGADFLAKCWAIDNNVPFEEVKADWNKHRKAAGPIRNKKMRDEYNPDGVIAFPGGTGTAGMIALANEVNLPVAIIMEKNTNE